MTTTLRSNDNWLQFNSHENQCFEDDEEEEEEALSLCDLPTNDHEIDTNPNTKDNDPVDFEFGSGHGGAACPSPENMCNADEVFFQGKILPLRHSVSSRSNENDRKTIRSNGAGSGYRNKPKVRNQFHSHPSPSPQIRTQSFRTFSHSKSKTTSLWSFLQVGLVKPQEIGLSDLKNRSKRSGSYNSNSSSSTSSSMNSTKDQNHHRRRKTNKKKQRLLLGGCNCSPDSIERTIKETAPTKKSGAGRQAVTRHRTFEWLKQLSIAAPSEA